MGRPRKDKVEEWEQFTLRLPPGMRDQLHELAEQNGRSANAEIVARLQASIASGGTASLEVLRQVVRQEVRASLEDAKG